KAAGLLNQLLESAPDTPEAVQLLAWVEAHRWERGPVPFQAVLRDAEKSWTEPLRPSALESLRAVLRRSPWGQWALLAAAALVAAGAWVPLPRVFSASAQLAPAAEDEVLAPHTGAVRAVLVHEGEPVEEGTPLLTWDTDEVELRLLDAYERLET